MPTEQQKKKTAQTLLQTAQDPSNPSNMARILGVAGEGLADFGSKAYEYMVPQSVEELALEGSPAGKAIGTAVGLIPPRLYRPLIERLRSRVGAAYPMQPELRAVINRQIDDNPAVAAHLTDIEPMDEHTRWMTNDGDGVYGSMYRPLTATDAEIKRELTDPLHWRSQDLERTVAGPTKWWGGEIKTNPKLAGNINEFADTVRHEFNHGAQDIQGQLPKLQEWTENLDYYARPEEIGARISERRGKWLRSIDPNKGPFSYPKALEGELNLLENHYALNPEKFPSLNESVMYMNEQLKPKGLRIVASMPGNPLGMPASIAPRRRFNIEKIVLDR